MLRAGVIVAAAAAALAAGCGSSDSSPSGSPSAPPIAAGVRGVDSAACSDVHYGGPGKPELLIVSTLPLQGLVAAEAQQASRGIDLVLEQRGYRAGRHTVGYQSCDDSTVEAGLSDPARCAANARDFARTPGVVGVIGPFFSSCAPGLLPAINRRTGGQLAVVSGSATYVGLTKDGHGTAQGDPERFYPTGDRNFFRIEPPDDVQGAADALTAEKAGVRRAYVLHDGSLYGRGVAEAFRSAARRSGIAVLAFRPWDPKARGYRREAQAVRDSGADGIFLGGLLFSNGARLIRDLRAAVGPDVPLVLPDGFGPPSALVQRAGPAAENAYISKPDIPRAALTPAGRRFHDAMKERLGKPPCCHTVQTGEAASVLLDAIAASDGTRASVTAALRRVNVAEGLIGPFRFDARGDSTMRRVQMHQIRRGQLRFVAFISPPAGLAEP